MGRMYSAPMVMREQRSQPLLQIIDNELITMASMKKYLVTCDRKMNRREDSFCMLITADSAKQARMIFDKKMVTSVWHPFHVEVHPHKGDLIPENVLIAYHV